MASSGGQVPVPVVVAAQFKERHAGRRVTHGGGVAGRGRGNQRGIVGGNGALISRVPPNKIGLSSRQIVHLCCISREIYLYRAYMSI